MKIINPGSDKHREQLEMLAQFIGADEIEYKNLGNGEDYLVRKGGFTLTLSVRGNKFDGGFLCVK
jgi:hypothetical protein